MFSICSLCYVLLMSCFCCLLTVCLHFPCHYSFLVYQFQVVIVIQYSVLIVSIVQPLDLTNKAYGRSYFANVGVGGGGGGGGGTGGTVMRVLAFNSSHGSLRNLYRPFPSCLLPLFQTESKCEIFHMKMSMICIRMDL